MHRDTPVHTRRRSPASILLAMLLFGAAGCGLGDYHSRMDKERERIQQFDEANRLLDEPIDVPKVTRETKEGPADVSAWPIDLYLRLPRGYGIAPKDKTPYYNFLFRYSGGSEGYNIFIAAASLASADQKELAAGEYPAKMFRSFIKPALEDYCLKALKIPPPLKEINQPETRLFKPLIPYPDAFGVARNSYSFFTLTTDDNKLVKEHSAFDVYIHEKSACQVCIIVHRASQAPSAGLKSSIEACLGTLDVERAKTKRNEYKMAKGIPL